MIYLLAFLAGAVCAGFVAEWVAEVLGVTYSNAVNGRYARLTREEMAEKVWRARKAGLALLLLSQADSASIFGGFWVYSCVVAGAAAGGWHGLGHVMWSKWTRLNGPKPATTADDEEDE